MMDKTSRGFTLIEVLIVLTLLGIMVVLLFASLKICADSWHKGENKITQVNEIAVVYNFFQQHLAVAKPLLNGLDKTNKLQSALAFQGKPKSLQFVSSFPASVGRSGLQLFSIEMQKETNEQLIKVTITPFFPLQETTTQKEEVVLLRRVSHFSLAYFGSDDGTNDPMDNASWHDEWLDKMVQPRLIKITLKLDNGLFCPDMIIPLKITEQPLPPDQADTTNNPIVPEPTQ
jgi:general secretion pathway protein J